MALTSDDYRRRDRACLWHPYSRRSAIRDLPFPVIERAEGIHLIDVDGRRYVDAVSSWWCCNLGHGHPRVVEAIRAQAAKLQHSILGNMSHPGAIELAERLAALVPGGGGRRVLFASDGACAVEAALKIAVQYWWNTGERGRHRLISLEDSYHGDTLGALSAGFLEGFHAPFAPLAFDVLRAESPCCGTCRHGQKPETCSLPCLESMRRLLERHGAETAAVIAEPLCQGAGGMRIHAARYLAELAGLCRRAGALFIADEVAVGFGRTGRMFAFEHAGIEPDIVCLGKGLTAGYLPVSATVAAGRVFAAFDDSAADGTLYHGHTFGGNPIGCAAALATLDVYRDEGIVARAQEGGAVLREALEPARALPGVRDVRSLGMIGVVELEPDPPGAREPRARVVQRLMAERGILVRPLGPVLYLMPPLVTPPGVLRELAAALVESVRATAGAGQPQ